MRKPCRLVFVIALVFGCPFLASGDGAYETYGLTNNLRPVPHSTVGKAPPPGVSGSVRYHGRTAAPRSPVRLHAPAQQVLPEDTFYVSSTEASNFRQGAWVSRLSNGMDIDEVRRLAGDSGKKLIAAGDSEKWQFVGAVCTFRRGRLTEWESSPFYLPISDAVQWCFSGHYLGQPLARDWGKASDDDRLVTAARWLLITRWKGYFREVGDCAKLQLMASKLKTRLDNLFLADPVRPMQQVVLSAFSLIEEMPEIWPDPSLYELEKAEADKALLALLDWNFNKTSSFVSVQGQVRNKSDRKLEYVEAVASFYAIDGTFISSDSAVIEYNPILPGQVSPFKIFGRYNPSIGYAEIEFKYFLGGTIPTSERD